MRDLTVKCNMHTLNSLKSVYLPLWCTQYEFPVGCICVSIGHDNLDFEQKELSYYEVPFAFYIYEKEEEHVAKKSDKILSNVLCMLLFFGSLYIVFWKEVYI